MSELKSRAEQVADAPVALIVCNACAARLRSHERRLPVKGGKAMQSAYLMLPTGMPILAVACFPSARAQETGSN